MRNQCDRTHVAWDIETTGFGWSDEITVSGFWFPNSHATLVLNSGPHDVDGYELEERLADTSGIDVAVRVTDNEEQLLHELKKVMFDRFDQDYNRLIAFNADSWKGGFDLPFVRTSCV